MASYMPQPDSGNTCCDCPDRTSPCDDCGSGTGACCNFDTNACTEGVTHDDCVASGGIYLGNGTTCAGQDCACCPVLDNYTQVHFGGQVLGCTSGTIDLPAKVWTKVAAPGCDVNNFEFNANADCSCFFNAQNCNPHTEVGYVQVTEVECDSATPGCTVIAYIFCNGTVYFQAQADGFVCCNVFAFLNATGPYDFTNGPLDVTLNADTGDTSIQFRFMLSLT